ncbi:MAG: DUF1326 domain-containing protein [Chloroflexi bacterium]|nr:DUF1326 domain-containing protein [Chloroflexota bacterium]
MAEMKLTWRMKGTVLIACNCEYGCPCNVNGRPTLGHCEGGWIWQVEQGAFGDTKLDGLSFGLFADWPAAIHEGNGVATYLVDARASEDQRAAIRALVEGGAGGPWGIFRKTFAQLHGPRYVAFDVDTSTQLPRAHAGDAVAIETEHIRNPVTKETVHPRLALPEGLVAKELALLASRRFHFKDEHVSYDHSGRYAASGYFQYFGP